MNTLEQAILGPIRSELIGHIAIFYSICGKTVAENITDVELDSCAELIRITADKIILHSPFAFKCNGVFISLSDDVYKKLIGKELKLGDEPVEI